MIYSIYTLRPSMIGGVSGQWSLGTAKAEYMSRKKPCQEGKCWVFRK